MGNIATDCASARKYYYFVRLMGRTPSNLALEVALNTCPNSVLIGEHVQDSNMSLSDIVNNLSFEMCT